MGAKSAMTSNAASSDISFGLPTLPHFKNLFASHAAPSRIPSSLQGTDTEAQGKRKPSSTTGGQREDVAMDSSDADDLERGNRREPSEKSTQIDEVQAGDQQNESGGQRTNDSHIPATEKSFSSGVKKLRNKKKKFMRKRRAAGVQRSARDEEAASEVSAELTTFKEIRKCRTRQEKAKISSQERNVEGQQHSDVEPQSSDLNDSKNDDDYDFEKDMARQSSFDSNEDNSSECSSNDSDSNENPPKNQTKSKVAIVSQSTRKVVKSRINLLQCPDSSTNDNDDNGVQLFDKNNMQSGKVHVSKKSSTKQHYCVFCDKAVSKMPRHMIQVHSDEISVKEVTAFSPKSKIRKKLWQSLMNKGDYAHNMEVLKSGDGFLIPKRRTENMESSAFIPCERCLVLISKHDMWRHAKNCPMRDEVSVGDKAKRKRHHVASSMLLPSSDQATTDLKEQILSTLAQDEISLIIRNDPLIVSFAMRLFIKHGNSRHQHQYIRSKLRELGRLLLEARRIQPSIVTLSDCIDPARFMDVVKAVQVAAGYGTSSRCYDAPSLALKLGHSLHKCAAILKSEALQQDNDTLKRKSTDFIELYQNDWSTYISSNALATLEQRKWNKPKRLPLAEDLKTVNVHLKSLAEKRCKSLTECPDPSNWKQLAEVTLAQIILFNRRRGGESERMLVAQLEDSLQLGDQIQDEVAESLSDFEKQLAKTLKRVEIRGKRGRKVAVLLTESHVTSLHLLTEHRTAGGINVDNPFLFARAGDSQTPLRSSDVVRKFSMECGAKCPALITSTNLRKHVATVSQILNLKDHELDLLAGFLGHDIRVHRNYYRLPESTLEIARVSKLLLHVESGDLHRYKGKSLEEINVEDEGKYIS